MKLHIALGFVFSEQYIRVDVETSTDVIWELMTRVWGLTPPNLVISVTGGAKNFHMTPRLKDVFRKGLVKAAISTGIGDSRWSDILLIGHCLVFHFVGETELMADI